MLEALINQAHGLPTDAYTSADFMALEQDRLFGRCWHVVGFAHDVSEPGDVSPVMSAAGRPLLLVRDGKNVRVFHNFCRHRGMRLLESVQRNRRNIVCPYHAWCYGLDGQLLKVSHRHGYGKLDTKPADLPGLKKVRAAIWCGIVFVDLSNNAPEFLIFIAPLADRWHDYSFELLRPDVSMSFNVQGNWKLAVENFIDIYHVPVVHPGLNSYSDMRDHYFIQEGDIVFGEGNAEYEPTDSGAG